MAMGMRNGALAVVAAAAKAARPSASRRKNPGGAAGFHLQKYTPVEARNWKVWLMDPPGTASRLMSEGIGLPESRKAASRADRKPSGGWDIPVRL